jgi:hypothetical protein
MTCPKCGLQTLPEQKFCRSCGASLQTTTQPLVDDNATAEHPRTTTSSRTGERANTFVLWGLIVMFVGVAIGVVGKKLLHEDIVTVVGILMSLAGMFITVFPYLVPPRAKQDIRARSQPEELPAFQPPKNLPKERIDFVPSITERTTSLLESRPASSTRQKKTEN